LKSFKLQSCPFWGGVNRDEVPDYYNIIKNPIDLSSITEKLRKGKYMKKDDFKNDLDLIWSNCYTYNRDLSSVFRIKAKKLSQYATKLLQDVSDPSTSLNIITDEESYKKKTRNQFYKASIMDTINFEYENLDLNFINDTNNLENENSSITNNQQEIDLIQDNNLPEFKERYGIRKINYITPNSMNYRLTHNINQFLKLSSVQIEPTSLAKRDNFYFDSKMSQGINNLLLQQSITLLLSFYDFNEISQLALEVLCDVTGDFISNIGKMLRRDMDIPGRLDSLNISLFRIINQYFDDGIKDIIKNLLEYHTKLNQIMIENQIGLDTNDTLFQTFEGKLPKEENTTTNKRNNRYRFLKNKKITDPEKKEKRRVIDCCNNKLFIPLDIFESK